VHSHLTHAFLGPPKSKSQTASRSVQPFFHRSWQSVPILYNGVSFPLKVAPSHQGICIPIYCTIPWAQSSLKPKRHLDRFNRFCTSHCRVSPYFTMSCPFPSKLPISMEGSRPHLMHGSLGPPDSTTRTASKTVHPFLQG